MASAIVQSVGKQLGSLLVEEGKYLYEVRIKAKRLQRELEWMGCFLQDADNREHQDRVVKRWIADVRDITYEAEDIIERYISGFSHHREGGIHNIMKRFSCFICDARNLHNVGSYIDELRTDIAELTARLGTYGVQGVRQSESSTYKAMVREKRRTYSRVEDQHVIELKKEMDEIVNALVNEEFSVVGVSGMGGLGKTTFAKKIVRDAKVEEHFSSCVWVYVSQNVERRGAFEEILLGLGYKPADGDQVKVKEMTHEKLLEEICIILREKRCLVVLDDIWTLEDWELLEPAFGAALRTSPSKLLLTTRDEELPKQADPKSHSLKLRLLDKDEAWTLLNKKLAFLKGENGDAMVDGEMENLGRQMIEHCKGLPLAVVTLAGILATKKTVKEWKDVQDRTSIINEDVSSVLELSFYDLPFYLKPCFMYLGHFPEDHEIPVETLYSLWDAEGIVSASACDGSQDEGESQLDIAERYLNELVQRSMVMVDKYWENGKIRSCRLHDVIRYMCLKKCKEVNFLTAVDDSGNPTSHFAFLKNKRMRRCAIQFGDNSRASGFLPQFKLDTCSLRSLLVLPLGKPSEFLVPSPPVKKLKKLSLLRVLTLKGLSIDDKVVEAIGGLFYLRYLSFEGSIIDKVPSCIFYLKLLETFDLRVRNRVRLPNKFSKLERLRHLYLPDFFDVISKGGGKLIIGASDSQLGQMETLINFRPPMCRLDPRKMGNLRIFSLQPNANFIEDEGLKRLLESLAITSGCLMNPLRLSICSRRINEEPTSFTSSKFQAHIAKLSIFGPLEVNFNLHEVFPHCLTKLELHDCEIGSEAVSQVEKLPYLEDLTLRGKWREKKMSFSEGSFPQLLKLTLSVLKGLEQWEVSDGALPNLRHLVVDECHDLGMIPQNLPSLLKVKCYGRVKGVEKYGTLS